MSWEDFIREEDQRIIECLMVAMGWLRLKKENGEEVWVRPGYLFVDDGEYL